MCGISGKFYFKEHEAVSEKEIMAMNEKISHRGPDDSGVFISKNLGMGHRRLSVIDLSPFGRQPMSINNGNIQIVFNGEIYNFLQLRKNLESDGVKFRSKTDTEVILRLYEKYGAECVKHLRGMFAFAIWDNGKHRLFLARDRVGKKPLKYYADGNVFIFASELKAILKNKEVKKELDFDALDEYLTYQYVPHPKTGFKNIFKLEPAHYMTVEAGGKITKTRYWHLDYSQKSDHSQDEWEKLILEKLKESVELRLVSDVPLGIHLSGGIDSGLITALAAEKYSKPLKTFSIGFKEKDYDERKYARLVSEKYKTDHREFIIEPDAIDILPQLASQYEEPYADSSALPTWHLSKMTREFVTVALNGDGGDENFAGYERYNAVKLFSIAKNIPFKNFLKKAGGIAYAATGIKTFRMSHRFFDSYRDNLIDFYLRIIDCFGEEEKTAVCSENLKNKVVSSRWRSFLYEKFSEAKSHDQLDKILYIDINSNLCDDLLVKVDIASMAHALEARSPFLDHEFMELAAKMPSNFKMKGFDKKYILKKIAAKYLPKECIYRKKQGFGVPMEYWFKGELANYAKEKLLGPKFTSYELFKKEELEKILNNHLSRKENYSGRIWTLLMLEAWLEAYFG